MLDRPVSSLRLRRLTRQQFLRRIGAVALVSPAMLALAPACADDDSEPDDAAGPLTADQALERLLAGNARFAAGDPEHPDQSDERRDEVAQGQRPFATVLGCVDSRVPPELVFDQGVGSLFTTRVAGNVLGAEVVGSIEFGWLELGIPLVVVLGHERCGAVTAAVEIIEAGDDAPGSLQAIVDAIAPAIDEAGHGGDDVVDDVVRANARLVAEQLAAPGTILGDAVAAGSVRIVAMHFDLDTGEAEVLG